MLVMVAGNAGSEHVKTIPIFSREATLGLALSVHLSVCDTSLSRVIKRQNQASKLSIKIKHHQNS